MSMDFAGRCGTYCGECTYREQFNCPGCMKTLGKQFWGECKLAKCSIAKGLQDCGKCASFVCQDLQEYAFDPEHGDNGLRIENLKERNAEGTENWIKRKMG